MSKSQKFPGAPIKVGRSRLSSGNAIQTIVINNKVSNVCAGGDGVANAEYVCRAVADVLNLSGGAESVLPSSTGIIGWRLPAKELAEDVIPKAVENMQNESAFNAARDIMTTDRYPKLRSKTLSNGARIIGIAKVKNCYILSIFFLIIYLSIFYPFREADFSKSSVIIFSLGCWND